MKIADLNPAQLASALDRVEKDLSSAPQPTKRQVVKSLAALRLCSPTSEGTQNTLLKALKANGIPLTPTFATLMGEKPSSTSRGAPSGSAPQTTTVSVPAAPARKAGKINLRAVSVIVAKGRTAEVKFIGGGVQRLTNFDASELSSSLTLAKFNG